MTEKHSWTKLWSWYLGVAPTQWAPQELLDIEYHCEKTLRPVPEKLGVRLLRKHSDPILRQLSAELRLKLTSGMKKIRNPTGKLLLLPPEQWELFQLFQNHQQRFGKKPNIWKGKRAAICISHDVDNRQGYEFIPEMLKRQSEMGIRGTFNFVTSYDYRIGPKLLESVEAHGFETGLHCLTHDIGLAYRPKRVIRQTLSKAMLNLTRPVSGYRSPALSVSPALFEVLSEQGVQYDSSIQVSNPKYHCTGWPFPFPLVKYGMWEMPLTLQDDIFLRDASTPIESVLKTLEHVLDPIVDMGGLFVMILHPHLMRYHDEFYTRVLEFLGEYQADCWIAPTGEVYEHISASYANHLNHSK